jgi:RNA polymerase sigma-70 factor, ECF subfamily
MTGSATAPSGRRSQSFWGVGRDASRFRGTILPMSAPEPDRTKTTHLLRALGSGDAVAAAQLMPLVYEELHRIAGRLMHRERASHTLQATALLNEAFVRLIEPGASYADRSHFLRVAARAMRNVLVDHARARASQKRDGGVRVDLDTQAFAAHDDGPGLLIVDETLAQLAASDTQLAQLVELRFFGGLDNREIAQALDMSLRSVERGWRTARAFLARSMELREQPPTS